MTHNRYVYAVADGSPNYSHGFSDYANFQQEVFDRLRWHRGKGFQINDRQKDRLPQVLDDLHKLLDNQPADTVFKIKSVKDGYDLNAKRTEVQQTKGETVIQHAREIMGSPYVFGAAGPIAFDCSGETLWIHRPEGIDLPHNAAAQHSLFRNHAAGFYEITRAQVKVGDLVFFHDDQHVAPYAGRLPEYGNVECVIDAEPHDTTAPAGWPTTTLRTGIRVRPMTGNYYCSWAFASGVGRIAAINGAP